MKEVISAGWDDFSQRLSYADGGIKHFLKREISYLLVRITINS
jgi:hypothetical protein